jgi:hypothetical protein
MENSHERGESLMPWYRIFASHGPGHQSSDEFYRWYETPLDTKEDKKNAWDVAFESYDNATGDIELCDRLPHHIREEKIEDCRATIEHARRMLTVLGGTLTKPVICVRLEIVPRKPSEKMDTGRDMGYQARLMAEPNVLGPIKPKKDEAVDALLSVFRRENRKIRRSRRGATRYSRRQDYAVIER